jgi:hypothetical protein
VQEAEKGGAEVEGGEGGGVAAVAALCHACGDELTGRMRFCSSCGAGQEPELRPEGPTVIAKVRGQQGPAPGVSPESVSPRRRVSLEGFPRVFPEPSLNLP